MKEQSADEEDDDGGEEKADKADAQAAAAPGPSGDDEERRICDVCEAGTFASSENAPRCIVCPGGKYADHEEYGQKGWEVDHLNYQKPSTRTRMTWSPKLYKKLYTGQRTHRDFL